MPAYNKTFELTPEEIDLIEKALREKQRQLLAKSADNDNSEPCDVLRGTHELLGRLHNQKNFYRPKTKSYIGG
ncbi:MAG: hypothetical protein AAGA08_04830 [Pseudomonadota bacterium]